MIPRFMFQNALPRLFFLTGCGAVALALAGCLAKIEQPAPKSLVSAHINNTTKFSSADFGVKGSPRVTTARTVRKGGGYYKVGGPYTVRGKKYYPQDNKNLNQTGMASWYGPNFHGRLTANGEIYDQYSLSAAHPTLPLPSYAKVINLENGRSIIVRVNDRGPYAHGRVIDLSAQAAQLLDYANQGVAKVRVQYQGEARMDGLDDDFLMASYQGPGTARDNMLGHDDPNNVAPGQTPGTMIAMAEIPQLPATATPVAAISQNFAEDQRFVAPLDLVPVPIARPVLFEENATPIGLVFRAVRQPLAYAENLDEKGAEPQFADFVRRFRETEPYLGDRPLAKVEIEFGLIDDEYSQRLLAELFQSAGMLNISDDHILAMLTTNEYYANAVLQFAREIGLFDVKIR